MRDIIRVWRRHYAKFEKIGSSGREEVGCAWLLALPTTAQEIILVLTNDCCDLECG